MHFSGNLSIVLYKVSFQEFINCKKSERIIDQENKRGDVAVQVQGH